MKKLIDIGDYGLEFDGQGKGRPVVVLDAGLNATADFWSLVQPAVAQFTRACSYDRVGMGHSDVVPKPRTCRDFAEDLHALLERAGEIGPFVVIGHSFGGLIARVYASAYPQEVSGMVLVDSPDPDYPLRALNVLPPPHDDEPRPGACESPSAGYPFSNRVGGPAGRVPGGISLRSCPPD